MSQTENADHQLASGSDPSSLAIFVAISRDSFCVEACQLRLVASESDVFPSQKTHRCMQNYESSTGKSDCGGTLDGKVSTAPSQTVSQGQMIQMRFATNRNQTGDDSLFGSAFRGMPPLFVTGTIDVYHRGGSPNPNWCPDRKSLRINPIPKATTSSIPEAVAAAPSTVDGITTFIDELAQNEDSASFSCPVSTARS
jgi:hypothetical protein